MKLSRYSEAQALKSFTRGESRLLESVADRIFPRTDTPGAVEAGAVEYIDEALAGDYAHLVSLYRTGLRAVNRHARRKFGKRFLALNGVEKDAILWDLEKGEVRDYKRGAEFFEMLRCHVLEGVFGEPRYGGNRGMIGWRLVGFPGQQFGYPDAYINRLVDMSPVAVERRSGEDE